MTSNIHPFGETFKRLREYRGLSLKEAAGDIVSPQFLGRFERGEKGISIENFSRLLISIGQDWRDFSDEYEGDRLTKYEIETTNNHLDVYTPGIALKRLNELLADYNNDNPMQKRFIMLLLKLIPQIDLSSFTVDKKEVYEFIHHFNHLPDYYHLNIVEFDLFYLLIDYFPLKTINNMVNYLLDEYHNSHTLQVLINVSANIHNIINYYLNNGYLETAFNLITEMKTSRQSLKSRLIYENINLKILECSYYFLINNSKAIELAQEIFLLLNVLEKSMGDFTGQNYISNLKEGAKEKFYRLNKTGIDLNEL